MEFLTEVIPELFNGAMDDMRAAAEGGDEKAKSRLASSEETAGAMRVLLEGDGGGDVYLVGQGGKLTTQDSAPDVPVVAAFAVPAEAIQIALEEMGDDLEKVLPKVRKRIANSPPASPGMMDGIDMKFHSVLKDTPDFEQVLTKITLGSGDIAETPSFTINMDYEVFEQLKERKLKPQAMMSKLQIDGDASQFMQMGMDFMAKMKPK
jgi:hypothetical protein